jgi:hypothetical protein
MVIQSGMAIKVCSCFTLSIFSFHQKALFVCTGWLSNSNHHCWSRRISSCWSEEGLVLCPSAIEGEEPGDRKGSPLHFTHQIHVDEPVVISCRKIFLVFS